MPEGGCLCGKIRVSYTGEPAIQAVCHCTDCRKLSGSAFSTNVIVPQDQFKLLSGTPKTFDKHGGSGKNLRSFFCGDCGTTCYRDAESLPGLYIVKAGVLDVDDLEKSVNIDSEFFAGDRLPWLPKMDGMKQVQRPEGVQKG